MVRAWLKQLGKRWSASQKPAPARRSVRLGLETLEVRDTPTIFLVDIGPPGNTHEFRYNSNTQILRIDGVEAGTHITNFGWGPGAYSVNGIIYATQISYVSYGYTQIVWTVQPNGQLLETLYNI